jgi:DNA-binding response OmpR family regulator
MDLLTSRSIDMSFASPPLKLSFTSRDKEDTEGRFAPGADREDKQDEAAPRFREAEAPRARILVVDDDPMIRATLRGLLRSWGYHPSEAATTTEALEIFRREHPAAVLVDLKVQDGSGISVLNNIKRSSPETVLIVMADQGALDDAFHAGAARASGVITKPIDEARLSHMLRTALERPESAATAGSTRRHGARNHRSGDPKRGRPRGQSVSPLGQLLLREMRLLNLSYDNIVAESKRLAVLNGNPDMRIGKSTLGNIISGSIRQPGTAKLDSLRIILHLSRSEMDAAIGLRPERRLAEQLAMTSNRTHEVTLDAVSRQRKILIPVLRRNANLAESQLLAGLVQHWVEIDVEYLTAFYPPYLRYVVVGEGDTYASPIAPPGTRLLVNTLLTQVRPAENVSFHERELFYVLTPQGLTCSYLENSPAGAVVLVPHPLSGHVRQEFDARDVTVIGQVVGLLYKK